MDKKIIIEEKEEVLESNNVPEELKKYLEEDNNTFKKIEEELTNLDNRIENLNTEKEESEKSFNERLAKFEEELRKEKEEAFEEFDKRQKRIEEEKEKLESIKLEEQGNQVNYIDSLKETFDSFTSKISSIEEAIKACEDNETLNKALEEEKSKLENALNEEYNNRKNKLDEVLKGIGLKEEIETKIDYNNFDLDSLLKPEIKEEPVLETVNNNEVIEHESVKDVINEIYESEDIMENHVFPYLKAVRE